MGNPLASEICDTGTLTAEHQQVCVPLFDIQYPHPVSRYIQCQPLWQTQPASERHPCRIVSGYSGPTLQTEGPVLKFVAARSY